MKTGRFMLGERFTAVFSLDRGTRTASWYRFSGQTVRLEAVQKLGDLLLTRTDWLADPLRGSSIASAVRRLLNRPLPQYIWKSNTVRKGI